MRIRVDVELPRLPRGRRQRLLAAVAVTLLVLAFPLWTLASHQFSDVPNGHPFHGDIAAIANAGVTSGCGSGKYCPDRNVTRAEMAAFMNRLGALGDGKTPVVNADEVDGMDGTAILLGTATIPSGQTVTGFAHWDHAVAADNQDFGFAVQLPARAPVALTPSTVNFAPSLLATDDDATCTGTAHAPTAPAGRVCIYLYSSLHVDGAQGLDAAVPGMSDRGFVIRLVADGTAGQDMYVYASWAYTAP